MATFRKTDTGKWRVEVYFKGKRKSKVCINKAKAREWASKIEYELSHQKEYISSTVRVRDLFQRYIREVCPLKKGHDKEVIRINMFCRHTIADYLVSEVTAKDISSWRDERLKQVKGSSVNREMNTLSSIFQYAVRDWEWSTINPVRGVTRPKEPKPRDRRISNSEIKLILEALNYEDGIIESKQHQVAVMFLLALETAMRLGEIHSLVASDVFLSQRYVSLGDTKNNDRRNVPLSKRAVELIEFIYPEMIDVNKGSVTTLFRKAVKKAGIENLRFHDSRHEAITNLAQKLDVLDLARMIGHRDPKSLMIYYNATATEIAGRLD